MAIGPSVGSGGIIITDQPFVESCTLYYIPGPGAIIPGQQNVNILPPGFTSKSGNKLYLRVGYGGTSKSGDQMCMSYNQVSEWRYITGKDPATYERGCCIAEFYSADNSLTLITPPITTNKCEMYIKDVNGNLIKPSKECCSLRGFVWDDINKKCLPK